jgi:hypothetical protein
LPNRIPDDPIKGAFFHKWVDFPYEQKESYPFMGNVFVEKSKMTTRTMALVELPNGWCQIIEVERVQFTDKPNEQ